MSGQLYTLDPLFDFHALFDIDFGLYKLIKEEYYDRNVFDNNLFDSDDDFFIKVMLLIRQNVNPLHLFCQEGKLTNEEKDNLYQEFLDKEYDKILERAIPTAAMEIASVSNDINKIVNVTVICQDNREKKIVEKHNIKLKCIVSPYINFNITKYDAIYIKNIYTLNLFKHETINNKTIVIPRFYFNMENASNKIELPIIEVTKKYYKNNKFVIIDAYNGVNPPNNY